MAINLEGWWGGEGDWDVWKRGQGDELEEDNEGRGEIIGEGSSTEKEEID